MDIRQRPIRLAIAGGVSALIVGVSLAGAFAARGERSGAAVEVTDDAHAAGADHQPLPDGSYFGTIAAAYVAPDEITFDRLELLVGDDARAAAERDGRDTTSDFYIRDTGAAPTSLGVSRGVVVTRVECEDGVGCAEGSPQDYSRFTLDVAGATAAPGDRHYRVVVDDGLVVRIDEQYFP